MGESVKYAGPARLYYLLTPARVPLYPGWVLLEDRAPLESDPSAGEIPVRMGADLGQRGLPLHPVGPKAINFSHPWARQRSTHCVLLER